MGLLFFTGFPGFLGSELLPRVLARDPGLGAACLVQPKFAELARRRLDELEAAQPALSGRVELVEGDITRPDLGLADGDRLRRETVEVYHLAAVYDIEVRRRTAMRVNVDGTRHVLDFAAGCPDLARFQYVSTCYVSGRYAGIYGEEDLVKGQRFNNYYEETKYLAEVEVQERMQGGLPATVYRPAIVVGDSRTGATQKYDGPYFVIRWLLRQPGLALMPMVGDPSAVRVNVVPRDFVVDAVTHLSGLAVSAGKVYQLCDPEPPTVEELVRAIGKTTRRKVVPLPLPLGVAKAALGWVPGVYWLMKIPAGTVDYFVHPTHYTCANTLADLDGSGIRAPTVTAYLDRLVDFVRRHPEISSAAMT